MILKLLTIIFSTSLDLLAIIRVTANDKDMVNIVIYGEPQIS